MPWGKIVLIIFLNPFGLSGPIRAGVEYENHYTRLRRKNHSYVFTRTTSKIFKKNLIHFVFLITDERVCRYSVRREANRPEKLSRDFWHNCYPNALGKNTAASLDRAKIGERRHLSKINGKTLLKKKAIGKITCHALIECFGMLTMRAELQKCFRKEIRKDSESFMSHCYLFCSPRKFTWKAKTICKHL